MNAPPALVEAFLARILRAIDDARALPPDRVLVRPMVPGYLEGDPDAAEIHRSRALSDVERWGSSSDANPGMWPVGLPLPLTVADALEAAERAAPAMAAELAAEVVRLAGAVVASDVLDQVLDMSGRGADIVSGWPFPEGDPPRRAAPWLALYELTAQRWPQPFRALVRGAPGFGGPWPGDVPPLDVATWARDGLDRDSLGSAEVRGAGTMIANSADPAFPLRNVTLRNVDGTWRRYPGIGLALLYLAERAELPRVRATVAARLAFASVRSLAGARDPGPLHFAALEAVLGENDGDGPARLALADGATRARFAVELVTEARTVAERAFLGDAPEAETEARSLAGDVAERFAVVLDAIEPTRAGDVRAAAAERAEAVRLGREPGFLWIRWFNPDAPEAPPGWLEMLAEALWFGRWRPALEGELAEARERARVLVPALHIEAADSLRAAMSVHEVDGDQLLGRDGRTLAILAPAGLADALGERARNPSAAEIRSVDAHRFLLWFLATIHARWVAGEADFRALRVDGRWPGLAELVKASDGRGLPDRTALAKIVPFMGRIPIPGPPGTEPGNLYTFDPGAPSRRNASGWFVITAGTMLHPGAIKTRPSWDRDTVPFPGLPPMAGVLTRANEHGQIATLRLYTVRRLAIAGAELVTEGGGLISPEDWLRDLQAVGLREPMARWDRVRDAWIRDGDDAPAFLVQTGRDRYHLNPEAHLGARAYLDHGAKLSRATKERLARKGRK